MTHSMSHQVTVRANESREKNLSDPLIGYEKKTSKSSELTNHSAKNSEKKGENRGPREENAPSCGAVS